MFNKIKRCRRCGLCKNQKPLLDSGKKCRIFWVGLSAKKVNDVDENIPLSPDTNSGALIRDIELKCREFDTYKTNIVKCLPLDVDGKLRYPDSVEMNICFKNLILEIEQIQPKIIFLLGEKVKKTVEKNLKIKFDKGNGYDYSWKKYNEIYYVPIHHPSYISVYKRKNTDEYINGVEKVINILLK